MFLDLFHAESLHLNTTFIVDRILYDVFIINTVEFVFIWQTASWYNRCQETAYVASTSHHISVVLIYLSKIHRRTMPRYKYIKTKV